MFQPTAVTAEQLRQIAKDRVVKPLAERWPPMARQSAEAQERELADLTRDVADLLPQRETAETLALICEAAWTTLRRTHRGVTWPKSAAVCDAVQGAVDDWRSRTSAGGQAGQSSRPQRPKIPAPDFCLRKAEHFRSIGAEQMADYWTRLANDAAIAWRAWHSGEGLEVDRKALKGSENEGWRTA